MPQISVIVPVYKVEQYLRRCVDSILAQTFSDFELILVDDGSPDNSGAICDEYAQKDDRITVIHQENGGLSAARNAAIDWVFANSDSQWLTFIDSDDWIHPEYLQRLLDAAVKHQVSISACDFETTTGDDPTIPPEHFETMLWTPENFFLEHNVTATIACAKLYRKECFESIRYPVGKLHEDEFTTYKILFAQPSVVYSPAPLYCYFTNTGSITQSGRSRYCEDKYIAIEEQIAYFQKNGYLSACRSRMRIYLCMVHDKIIQLTADQANPDFLSLMKSKKHRYFKAYSRLLDPNDAGDAWVLANIYPTKMKVYWYTRAVLRKLRIIK
jgi:glycosyltransferase involved in cell wall biosynthesis